MERELQTYLRPGERVCWQGRPAPFPLLDGGTRKQTLRKWLLTALLGGGLLAMYLRFNQERSASFVGLVLLVAGGILLSPVLERHSVLRQRYWLTDQRAILMGRDKSFYFMELEDIDDFRVVRDMAPADCLVLGGCLFEEIRKQLRWRACHPKLGLETGGEQDRAEGLVFYCVDNAEGAAECLRSRLGRRRAA